jgi:hypothetical protein
MRGTSRSRIRRLFPILVVVIGAIAMLALPALASAKHHHRHPRAAKAHGSGHGVRHHLSGAGPGNTGPSGGEGENAGVIASFDGKTLTITLNDGQTLSGEVTGDTRIECHQGEGQQGSDDEPGDSGEGSDDQGQSEGGSAQAQDLGRLSSDQQSGDGQAQSGDDQGEGDDCGNCTAAALVPGAIVHEAELEIGPSGAVFDSVDLAG